VRWGASRGWGYVKNVEKESSLMHNETGEVHCTKKKLGSQEFLAIFDLLWAES